MLDETLQSQLRAYLTKIVQPVELIASLDESQGAQEMRALLETIASLTDKVSV
ncbi:MAG: alkyl hydroperoxide reductase subunit F, partial [Steroidobacteraceae bacterium]